MSSPPLIPNRFTLRDLKDMKKRGEKIVSLTAYSAPMASILDEHVDFFIVGDSVGMVLYGMDSTMGVTLEMMAAHAKAVVSHSKRAFVLVDMPFGAAQTSPADAFKNASRLLIESHANAVKIEGGMEMIETVQFLCERGIAVMAHIGLKPQHVLADGGYRAHGKTKLESDKLLCEAKAFEAAGAFGLLLEGIKEPTARAITEQVSIITIGIGASPSCDGQVLVTEDMLGLMSNHAKFVQTYANLRANIAQSVKEYALDVKAGHFPDPNKHCY